MQLRRFLDAFDGCVSISLASVVSSARQDAAFEGLLWLGGILAVTGLALLAISLVNRRVRQKEGSEVITLDELRHLHDQGKLSNEEYKSIRSALIRASK